MDKHPVLGIPTNVPQDGDPVGTPSPELVELRAEFDAAMQALQSAMQPLAAAIRTINEINDRLIACEARLDALETGHQQHKAMFAHGHRPSPAG